MFLKVGNNEKRNEELRGQKCMNSSNELCYVKHLFRNEMITGVFTECHLLRCQLTHKKQIKLR